MNRGDLLQWTMRSVSSQTYSNYEHIVVDGGSTDGTLALLNRRQGTYRLRWVSEPDGGMYAAINKGLRMATGDIVAYLNSDDLYLPWTLEVVVDCFASHPEADFVFGDALNIEDHTGRQRLVFQPPFDLDFITRLGFLTQPTVFWRRRVMEQQGLFDESLRYVADCDYWIRAGSGHVFRKVNEFVAVERDHRSTLRESHSDALSAELTKIRTRYSEPNGAPHRNAARRAAAVGTLWRRTYWAAFILQALLPRALRRASWSHLLDAGHTRVRLKMLPARLLPGYGRRFSRDLIAPSRHWLEPRADDADSMSRS